MADKILTGRETFPHPVEMPLTDKELLAYADELTTLDTELTVATEQHDSDNGRFKAESKRIAGRASAIMDRLRTKKELKDVDCYNKFDYFEGICEVRRVDNDVVVKTRKMTVEEFKGEKLPFVEDDEDVINDGD